MTVANAAELKFTPIYSLCVSPRPQFEPKLIFPHWPLIEMYCLFIFSSVSVYHMPTRPKYELL
jgi:hypothetical protein